MQVIADPPQGPGSRVQGRSRGEGKREEAKRANSFSKGEVSPLGWLPAGFFFPSLFPIFSFCRNGIIFYLFEVVFFFFGERGGV